MRIGLIADVHANLPALEAALGELASSQVDRLVCAGDVVGYGPHPNECVAALRAADAASVAGNHDLMAVGRLSLDDTGTLGRTTLEWTREELSADSREWLEGLPLVRSLNGLTVAHGSLADPRAYVLEPGEASGELAALGREAPDSSLLLLGHTHTPLAYAGGSGMVLWGRSGMIRLESRRRYLVNPGSVGQSRERRALVRFAVLDYAGGKVEFRGIPYDHDATRRSLAERGLPRDACHRPPSLSTRVWRLKAALRRAASRLSA